MKITDVVGDYNREFDMSALDKSSPWLPPPPIADTEASETRGALDVRDFGAVTDTLAERGKNYGDFTDNAFVVQGIKASMHDSPMWFQIDDIYIHEALEMIATKIGRLLSGNPYHIDGWHDIAGYATLVEQRLNKRSK